MWLWFRIKSDYCFNLTSKNDLISHLALIWFWFIWQDISQLRGEEVKNFLFSYTKRNISFLFASSIRHNIHMMVAFRCVQLFFFSPPHFTDINLYTVYPNGDVVKSKWSCPSQLESRCSSTWLGGVGWGPKQNVMQAQHENVCHIWGRKGKWPPLPRIFDLLLVALKEKWSTGAQQSARATGLEQERTDTVKGF